VIDLSTTTPQGGSNTSLLLDLHKAVMEAVMPVVDPRCEFTREEKQWSYERFRAHLTLAMKDIPEHLFDEVFGFVRQAEPIGPPAFVAERVQLLAFHSNEWAGRWWERLGWQLVHSWKLSVP
jgi:hypothetical protein